MKSLLSLTVLLAAGLVRAALADTQTVAIVTAAPPGPTGSAVFVFAPGHVRLTVPAYWTVVPEQSLLKYLDTLRNSMPGRAVPNYVLALQRKALFDFALPYVLIELNPGPAPTRAQVEGELLGFQTSIGLAYSALHRAGKFGEVHVQPAIYDETRHVVIGRYSLVRGEDKRRLACVTAIFPYREGFLRLHGFMRFEDQEKYVPVVEALIASVQFDAGYAYVPPPVATSPLAKYRTLMFGGLVGLMGIYLILRFLAARGARPR
jgi:hypothetical protein